MTWRLSGNKHGILVWPRITIGLDVEIPTEVATFGDLSRFLGTLSGLHLELQNVDWFLVDRLEAKPIFYSSTHLLLIGRTIIANHTLTLSLLIFHCGVVGSKKGSRKIEALCYHLWFGYEDMARAQMSWDICTMPKKVRGLSLISLENDMRALISGLFKHFFPANPICNLFWVTASHSCTLPVIAFGVLPIFACSPRISLSKAGQKFGVTLLCHERWWRTRLFFFSLCHSWRIFCNLTSGRI